MINTVQERSATKCLKNKVLRALRNESREVTEVRLGEESSMEGAHSRKVQLKKSMSRSQSLTKRKLKKVS